MKAFLCQGGRKGRGRLIVVAVALLAQARLAAAEPVAGVPDAAGIPRPGVHMSAHYRTTSLTGVASWYGGHHAGRQTASGEIFSTALRTAAHRNLPFGTMLRVTNLRNGRTSVVRVNDRGPFVGGRSIDLSEQAARDLAMVDDGLAPVRLEILSDGDDQGRS